MLKQKLSSKLKDFHILKGLPCYVCGKEVNVRNQPQGYIHKQYMQDCEKAAQTMRNAPDEAPVEPPVG